ncbi:latent-transforming growth factor beta-binding protein 4 isoform X2 [Ascaphus truei]|uniref:latent-transforming growth factor beta-binding protein 4 isoform X2 n=1 Tax=Ascaphus truei TaxID=8439 RepID=UPI003F5AB265
MCVPVAFLLLSLAVSQQLGLGTADRQRKTLLVPKSRGTLEAHPSTGHWQADVRGAGQSSPARAAGPGEREVKVKTKRVEKQKKSRHTAMVPKATSANLCGDKCCPGWSVAPKTGKCTKAVCTPKCKNGGLCRKPQVCFCKMGYMGPQCERASPTTTFPPQEETFSTTASSAWEDSAAVTQGPEAAALYPPVPCLLCSPISTTMSPAHAKEPAANTEVAITRLKGSDTQALIQPAKRGTSLSWQPLTLQELRSFLQRRGLASKDKMTTLLEKHLETQKSQMAKEAWKERNRSTKTIRAPQGEYTIYKQIHRSASGQGQVEKVKVMFTPMICHVRCQGERCTNHCEKGNMTTVYSDELSSRNREQGFRAFLCPLLCQNGGICLRKDKCLCPPNFTGKFCQIPVLPGGATLQGRRNISAEQHALTKSVYTLPLSNHHPDKDGGATIVKVHVEHPPEASVNIHQVESIHGRGQQAGERRDVSQNAVQQSGRVPLYRVQAQSSPRINGYTENSGFGYCFRRLENSQCASPLPGLRTQEICCRGSGVAWGVHDCTPCSGYQGDTVQGAVQESPCPKGFDQVNGTCVDIDECQESSFCQNGDCTNTRGSYSCICKTGYLLDSSRSSCISHHVISEAKGPCFRILRDGGCSLPILRNITKQICCCSRVGKAWGKACERCPPFGTEGFKETCPAGPGYHYSASDLRINTRFVGQDQARVPVQRQPGSRDSHPPTPAPSYLAVTSRFDVPEERRQDRPLIPGESRPPVRAEETGPRRVPAVEERDQGRVQVPDHRGPARVPVPAERGSSALDKISPTASPAATDTRVVAPAPESNLCELNPQICGPGRCVPRSGSYTCVCNNGYWLSTQGTHCIDMDECRQNPRPCANGRCENTVGSFRCACSTGFSTNPQGTECTDIDECASGQQPCASGHCENTPGSYRCVCPAGFTLSPQGTSCTDIDECRLTPRRNCLNGRCENTPGSFRCVCPPGFTANAQGTDCQDIDECRQTPRPCGSGRCQNTPGSFRCSCPTGFRLNPQGTDCMDMNECENPATCAGQECLNTPGSFQCRQCRAGYRLQNRRCVDINECQTETVCGPNGKCINTDGSFQCECLPGFRLNSDRTRCTDINECLEGEFCFPRGECLNTEGSYTCVCAEGYVTAPDGASCLDKDECQQGTLCQGGRCANTQGSFQCACPTGFKATSDKATCADIDECQERGGSLCGTQHCENTLGSYRCIAQCDAGYRLTASGDCADVNECANSTFCGDNAVCQNLIGSFRCTCNWGYEMSSEGQHCVDVDECLEYGVSLCGTRRCQNTPGSYKCITDCEPGYQLSSSGDCRDVNECLTLQGVCGMALCENVEGSFLCICPSSNEEFDPMTGKCIRSATAARPMFPRRPSSPRVDSVLETTGLKECYYNLEDPKVCENVLARNLSQAECCCSVGEGWGTGCQVQRCPATDTAEFQSLCPGGAGYVTTAQGFKDVDECQLYGSQVCKGGVCVNKVASYSCYCSNGYYYDVHQLECVDNDECHKEEVCEGGRCVNTVGSYHCTCDAPLVLDGSQRRCVTNTSQALDDNLAFCWQEVGADLLCKRPLLDRQTTYTECCCLYGEAWGMNCALCPARDSDDFEALCNVLRPPGFGNPGGPLPHDPYEYGSEYGPGYVAPYSPDHFANPRPRIVQPGYDAYPVGAAGGGAGYASRPPSPYGPRDSLYSYPPFESTDFEGDLSYPDPAIEEPRAPFRRPDTAYDPRLLPSPPRSRPRSPLSSPGLGSEEPRRSQPWRSGSRDTESLPPPPNWTRDLSEAYEDRYEQFEGLQAEECGILNGCENGRCIRVPEGYTCDCYDGYRLDMTRMACVDINECDEAEDLSILCLNGQCRNTDGSYECVCLRGFTFSRQHNYCVPSQR